MIWLTLARHPVIIRGSLPRIWSDPAAVRQWSIGNLIGYWSETASTLERIDPGVSSRRGSIGSSSGVFQASCASHSRLRTAA